MGVLLNWLAGRVAGPLMGVCALVFALALAVQTARIEGLPLIGGGLKAEVAGLHTQIAARDLDAAKAQAAALAARAAQVQVADAIARTASVNDQAIQRQIQTVIAEVPKRVDAKSVSVCRLPWGAVRLLDAAASGADVADVAARIAPGQPDDAPSDVTLPEAVALLATDLGIARQNAEQLERLEGLSSVRGN